MKNTKKILMRWSEVIKEVNGRRTNIFYTEGDIWWCFLGVNIGSEQDGKGSSFQRPVVILRKIRKDLILVAPLSSKVSEHKDRIDIYVGESKSQIMLSQVRVVSTKRLLRKIKKIKSTQLLLILIRLARIIIDPEKSETPHKSGESRSPKGPS